MKPLFFLLLLIVPVLSGYTQSMGKTDDSKFFSVGYENIMISDSGRVYKPGTVLTDRLHYRPLEIDIWYPAIHPKPDPLIRYSEFLDLLEKRSDRFQDDTVYRGLSSELLQYICINLKIWDTAKLAHLKTVSYRDADPVQQRFPLILYMCAYNGMSYENLSLFEWLAGHGYVVASVTSVGRYPGNMTTNPADTFEQVYDNRLDTAVFRLNIYNFKKGVPFENIMRQNVLIPVGKQTGRYTINLSDYRIIVKDDILLSLEWIEGSSSGPGKAAIFLSAGFLNSATWHRLTSQAEWKKAAGLGIGFNAMIQTVKK